MGHKVLLRKFTGIVACVQSQSIQEREQLIEQMEIEVEREEAAATARQKETAMITQNWQQQVYTLCYWLLICCNYIICTKIHYYKKIIEVRTVRTSKF